MIMHASAYEYTTTRELKKLWTCDSDTNCYWNTWNDLQRLWKEARIVGNQRMNGDYPRYSIVKISLNTEKNPRELRRFDIIQTPAKNHQLTPVWDLVWFGSVRFYGISTIVGYLMPNTFCILLPPIGPLFDLALGVDCVSPLWTKSKLFLAFWSGSFWILSCIVHSFVSSAPLWHWFCKSLGFSICKFR